MKKLDYDNAFTLLEQKRKKDLSILEFKTVINKLHKLNNDKIINEEDKRLLEVSLWDKAKFFMSKLGRYKAGGKIFGKGEIDQESAAKVQQIVDKKGNEMIKGLHDEIQKMNSKGEGKFPNNQDPNIFLDIILKISATYDSIVAATKLNPKEKGYLPVGVANIIIEDLREYVKKYLDVDLAAAYTVMDSKEESEEELITDSELPLEEDRESDVRSRLQAKGGDEKIDSIRMGKKGLASNRLPIVLSAIGGSLGILSWIAQTEWFKELVFKVVQDPDQIRTDVVNKTISDNLNVDDRGWSYTIQNNGFEDATGMNLHHDAPVENLHKAFEYYGGGDEQKGMDAMSQFLNPTERAESMANLKEQLADPSNKTIGDIFNKGEGTWGNQGLFGQYGGAKQVIATQVVKVIKRTLVKGALRTVVTSKIGAGLIKVAPWLGGLGIGLLGTGALVKIMREKGKRQSRAKTLDDLLQSLQLIKGDDAQVDYSNLDKEEKTNNNLCGKNVDELNKILTNVKSRATTLKGMKLMDYSDNPMFQKMLLESFLTSKVTAIKINGKAIHETLKDLYDNGLLEAPRPRDINKKQQLPQGWENQLSAFFTELFKLFALLNKSCKDNVSYGQIKKLFKQLYLIGTEGRGNYSDEQKRQQLFKKLVGTLHNFFSAISKLSDFTKGKSGKPSDEEIEKRRAAKERGRKMMDKNSDGNVTSYKDFEDGFSAEKGAGPKSKDDKIGLSNWFNKKQTSHYDRGDNVLKEEIKRIKRLM